MMTIAKHWQLTLQAAPRTPARCARGSMPGVHQPARPSHPKLKCARSATPQTQLSCCASLSDQLLEPYQMQHTNMQPARHPANAHKLRLNGFNEKLTLQAAPLIPARCVLGTMPDVHQPAHPSRPALRSFPPGTPPGPSRSCSAHGTAAGSGAQGGMWFRRLAQRMHRAVTAAIEQSELSCKL